MAGYVLRRLVSALPLLVAVSFLVFFLSRTGSRDPVDAILGEKGTAAARAQVTRDLGLDRPLIVQYGIYLRGIVTRFDFGKSYARGGQSVSEQIRRRFPATVELTLAALLLAIALGIPAGLLSAVYKGTWIDAVSMGVSLAGVSIPVFWLGLLLLLALGGIFPIGGRIDAAYDFPEGAWRSGFLVLDTLANGEWAALGDVLRHLALPALALATIPMAMTARITRAAMLDELSSDHVRTAKAKGLGPVAVVWKHGFRNALVPVVTLLGLEAGYLLGGAVLTETVFAWPGMGTYVVDSVFAADPMAICGASIVIGATFVAANLAVDLAYGFIDPRIRHGSA